MSARRATRFEVPEVFLNTETPRKRREEKRGIFKNSVVCTESISAILGGGGGRRN